MHSPEATADTVTERQRPAARKISYWESGIKA